MSSVYNEVEFLTKTISMIDRDIEIISTVNTNLEMVIERESSKVSFETWLYNKGQLSKLNETKVLLQKRLENIQ